MLSPGSDEPGLRFPMVRTGDCFAIARRIGSPPAKTAPRVLASGLDRACGSGGLRGCRLGSTPPAGDRLAWHLAGAVVAEVGLLRASACVGEVDPHHRALRLVDFLAAIVADQPRNTSHGFPPRIAQPLR